MNAAEYRHKAESLLAESLTITRPYEEGPCEADRTIAEAQVYATLAISAPEEPAAELAALRRAVAEMLHAAATSPDSEHSAVINRFREYLPATVHGDPVLALADEKILAIAVGSGPPEQQPDGRVSRLCAAVAILRRMAEGSGQAGEDTASSGESTQPAPSPDRRERYAAALREADTYAQLADSRDLDRFVSAAIAMADSELDPVYRSGYRTGRMHAGGGA